MTSSEASQPDPHEVLKVLEATLTPIRLQILPTALNLLAHLQLLSAQVRSEAARALRNHLQLMDILDEQGVDDSDRFEHGVLNAKEGKALRAVADAEAEYDREDVMMELSLEFRLLHVALVIEASGNVNASVLKLFNAYFPTLPLPPAENEDGHDASGQELRQWRDMLSAQSMCFIRAMTPDQARRMDLYRRRGETMAEQARAYLVAQRLDDGARSQRRKATIPLEELLPTRTKETSSRIAEQMLDLAQGVIDDIEVVQSIFPPDVAEEGSDDDMANGHPWQAPGDYQAGVGNEVAYPSGRSEGYYVHPDDSDRHDGQALVGLRSKANRASPPPLRQYTPQQPSSASRPFRAAAPSRAPTRVAVGDRPAPQLNLTPVGKRQPRRSVLPPIEGPDYTAALPSRAHTKAEMKPFDSAKVFHSPRDDKKHKRPRMSEDIASNNDIERATKRRYASERL